MRRIFFVSLCLFFIILIHSNNLYAEKFIKDYKYTAGDADSKETSRSKALTQVKILLLEEIGLYIESKFEDTEKISKSGKEQLSTQQTATITAGITNTKIIEEKWDWPNYWIKVEIDVDEKDVKKKLEEFKKEKDTIRQLEDNLAKAQNENNTNSQKIEDLKEQLYKANAKLNLQEDIKKRADKAFEEMEQYRLKFLQTEDQKDKLQYKEQYKNKVNELLEYSSNNQFENNFDATTRNTNSKLWEKENIIFEKENINQNSFIKRVDSDFVLSSYSIWDGVDGCGIGKGNSNRVINKDESIVMTLSLACINKHPIFGFVGTLTTNDKYIEIDPSYQTTSFKTIYNADTYACNNNKSLGTNGTNYDSSLENSYRFTVASDAPDNHIVIFDLKGVDAYGKRRGGSFTMQICGDPATIIYVAHSIYDGYCDFGVGNGNRIVNKSESIVMSIKLKNVSSIDSKGVWATLSTDNKYIKIKTKERIYFGDILGQNISYNRITNNNVSFEFTVSPQIEIPQKVPFNLTIYDFYGNKWESSFSIYVQ